MMKRILILLVGGHFFVNAMTGLDVMTRVQEESRKKNTRKAVVDMIIYDNKKRERHRSFTYWTSQLADTSQSLVTFSSPKNIKGTALLTKKDTVSGVKTQWVYFPAFKSVRRLSDSEKNNSFMGSDFTYADIAGRKLDQDTHELVDETDEHYFIESTPIDLTNDTYSKIRYVVSKTYHVVLKAVFYDLNEKKFKTLINKSISTINDMHVVTD